MNRRTAIDASDLIRSDWQVETPSPPSLAAPHRVRGVVVFVDGAKASEAMDCRRPLAIGPSRNVPRDIQEAIDACDVFAVSLEENDELQPDPADGDLLPREPTRGKFYKLTLEGVPRTT